MNFATQLPFDDDNITLRLVEGMPAFKPFFYLIDGHASKHPNNTAIKFNGYCWSYREIAESADKLATLFINNGVKKGDIIGIALDRSAEMIISLLAVLKSGAAYLPLDPTYPKDRIEFMLSDSSAVFLIISKKYRGHFISDANEIIIEDAWPMLTEVEPAVLTTFIKGDDLAYILYTTGSTGKPKGVLITHKNLANFLLSMKKKPGMRADDRLLAISTISFDIAAFELYLPLINGAQIVLASSEAAKDGWLLLELMKSEKISLMQATPYTWRMLIAAGWDEFLPIRIITGGEQLPKDLAEQLLLRCSQIWNQYGPTETTVYSTQKLITHADQITIGKPIDNTTVYILDDLLNKQPDGSVGEICIGGDGVAKGYLNRHDLTLKQFIADPFLKDGHSKIYKTGDLGCIMPNGEIQCLGRMDNQVKVRGFRIELEEIEYALSKAEGVKQAVAAVITETGDARIIAYVVASDNSLYGVLKSKWKQTLSDKLLPYMVPDDFMIIASVPVTPNGKIDRKALPKPAIVNADETKERIAPNTEMEKQLTEIWENLLGIQQISIDDNFFSLGGHSLVAVQIMACIQKISGKQLPIAALLKYPSIAELALYVNSNVVDTAGSKSLVKIKKGNATKKPLYIVHGEGLNVLYFKDLATNMDKEQPVYGLQAKGFIGEAPSDVMEEIAAGYVQEILEHDPVGPYFLAGYSFGGYVAIEMRKQLKAMEKEVAVIIFDTDAEKSEYKSLSYLIPRKVKRHFPRLMLKIGSTIANPRAAFKEIQNKVSARSPAIDGSSEYYKQIKNIAAKLRVALRNYDIEPFDDKVYLYKAKVCTHYVDDIEYLGWKKFAKKGVEICEVPGDHLSILLYPHVVDFAGKLQQGIDRLTVLQTNSDLQLS